MFLYLLIFVLFLPFPSFASSCFDPPEGMKIERIGDNDGDFIKNDEDNCANVTNADQRDENQDHVGDACDLDQDGFQDQCDNCVNLSNPDQKDENGNGIGDACEKIKSDNIKQENKKLPSKMKITKENPDFKGFEDNTQLSDDDFFEGTSKAGAIETFSIHEAPPPL